MANQTQRNSNAISKNGVSPARREAYDVLLKIERDGAYSSILLPIHEENLEKRDRGLCHQIVLGVLRRQIYLDHLIRAIAPKKLDLEVLLILRIGAYQLLFLDKIPAYSAINEAVNLVGVAKKRSAKGFVNAVLRKISGERLALEFENSIDQLVVETSHPKWLIEKWIGQFGFDETKKLAEANNEAPGLEFRRTRNESSFAADEPTREELFELADVGEIYFQDLGSQMVGEIVDLREGENFLDVCAAPGSKLTQIATMVKQTVYGGDLHFQRVKQIHKSAQKQGVTNIFVSQYNAETGLPFAAESFDVVLVDAPCSGTGTIRHNPEIRYTFKEDDLPELSAKQLRIFTNASQLVKSGGRLIYSTCSLEPEENEAVIEKFLQQENSFALSKPENATDNFVRTFPHKEKIDGFFVAILKKNELG